MRLLADSPEEDEMVKRLNVDWLLYGAMHITNAPRGNGITRLDPTRISYAPEAPKKCPYCDGQMCARFDGLGCTHDRVERHGYPGTNTSCVEGEE